MVIHHCHIFSWHLWTIFTALKIDWKIELKKKTQVLNTLIQNAMQSIPCDGELIEVCKEPSSQNCLLILSQGSPGPCDCLFQESSYFQGQDWLPETWKQPPVLTTCSELASSLNCNLLTYTMLICVCSC